jgi:lipoprotein-anchoring transpeptidase ErfK/SrfK
MLRITFLTALLSIAMASTCQAQWPWWADDVFGERRSWRSERTRPDRETLKPLPERRATPPSIADGGGRPEIRPQAARIVEFHHDYPVSSIVISTSDRKLFYVLEGGRAYEYPISVGREGFSWTGTETISRKQAWPDWYPPQEMRERDPKLPEKMTGGVRNPLGAMALYLGTTLYRIHGTNDAKSIGQAQSSGCFRMMNAAVLHLASLAEIGTPVTVVAGLLPKAPDVSRLQEPATTIGSVNEASAGSFPTYRELRGYALGR